MKKCRWCYTPLMRFSVSVFAVFCPVCDRRECNHCGHREQDTGTMTCSNCSQKMVA